MRIPNDLIECIKANDSVELDKWEHMYTRTYGYKYWNKIYSLAQLQISSKAFPSFDDESSMSEAIKPHHNED